MNELRKKAEQVVAEGIALEDDGRDFADLPEIAQRLYRRMAPRVLDRLLDFLADNGYVKHTSTSYIGAAYPEAHGDARIVVYEEGDYLVVPWAVLRDSPEDGGVS